MKGFIELTRRDNKKELINVDSIYTVIEPDNEAVSPCMVWIERRECYSDYECYLETYDEVKALIAGAQEKTEPNKEELAPLTVKELRGYLWHFAKDCKGCFLRNEREDMPPCDLDVNCSSAWTDYFIDEMTKAIRGKKK